jgi:Protein of unknown function (DUF3102)
MSATKADPKPVARPIKVLIELIKQDLAEIEKSALPLYRAIREKLLEAKSQMRHGEFQPWIKRNFKFSYREAARYMSLVKTEKCHGDTFENLRGAERQAQKDRREKAKPAAPPQFDLNSLKENAARREVAESIINTGYRKLAEKAHPDQGGSNEAMQRLNHVRDKLRKGGSANEWQKMPNWWTQPIDQIARDLADHFSREKLATLFAMAMDCQKARQARSAQESEARVH